MSPTREETIASFVEVARGFCAWCESPSLGFEPETDAASWLAALYAGALRLPKVESGSRFRHPIIPGSLVERAGGNLSHFSGSYYRQQFNPDPNISKKSVTGDLGDNVMNTYRDIKVGLLLFDKGRSNSAIWHWRLFPRIHWGHHAAVALPALHCLYISELEFGSALIK